MSAPAGFAIESPAGRCVRSIHLLLRVEALILQADNHDRSSLFLLRTISFKSDQKMANNWSKKWWATSRDNIHNKHRTEKWRQK